MLCSQCLSVKVLYSIGSQYRGSIVKKLLIIEDSCRPELVSWLAHQMGVAQVADDFEFPYEWVMQTIDGQKTADCLICFSPGTESTEHLKGMTQNIDTIECNVFRPSPVAQESQAT